jgi:preprotein translocase subunit SecF
LRKVGKKTQWHQTKSIINNLIQQTVETGAVTTVTALLELIFFLAEQNTSLHTTM